MSLKKPFFPYLVFSLFSLVFYILSLYFISKTPPQILGGFDIRAFYTGGKMLSHHVSSNFYDLQTQYFWQKDVFNLSREEFLMPFVYPSIVAIPFSFLSSFPVWVTYFFFAIVNSSLGIILLYFLLRGLKVFSSGLITFFSCLLFFSYIPLWEALRQGQLSFIIFAGFVMSWVFLKQKKYLQGGLFLSLIFVRPHLVIIPLLLFVWKKEWKVVFGLLLGIFFLILISGLTTGFASLFGYVKILFSFPTLNIYASHPQLEPTIRGFLQSVYHTDSLKDVIPAFVLISSPTIIALLYSWRGKFKTGERFNLQWAILILTTLLTSLHTNAHDLLLGAFILIVLFTSYTKKFHSFKRGLWKIILLFYVFLFFISIIGAAMYKPNIETPALFLTFAVLMLLLNRTPSKN